MTKKIKTPLQEHEKQTRPLAGEVSLEEARTKAAMFAFIEKNRIKAKSKKK